MPSAPIRFRIRLPCPPPKGLRAWGDYHFGMSLAGALERRGHKILMSFDLKVKHKNSRWKRLRYAFATWWNAFRFNPDIDFVLRGPRLMPAARGRKNIMWLISCSEMTTDFELKAFDHIFVASTSHAALMQSRGIKQVSVLLQCTDSTRFFPRPANPDLASECLFVGVKRKFDRISVLHAIRMGLSLKVWGWGWHSAVPPQFMAGTEIDNAKLGEHYCSARLVLNDHTPDMAEHGFTSNRVFDVLACGVPILSDRAADLPEMIAKEVYVFSDYESFGDAVKSALSENAERKKRRLEVAEIIAREHDFDARAVEIERVAHGILAS